VAILQKFSPNAPLLNLDAARHPETNQSFRLMYYGNVASDAVFSDSQLYSSDYSLQLTMSLQNFISLRCDNSPQGTGAARPSICVQLSAWADAQKKAINELLTLDAPGPDGGPLPSKINN
jgi:hypothetical protein